MEAADNRTEQDVIRTRTARIWLAEDGILRSVATTGAEMTLADAEENVAATIRIRGGRNAPLLLNIASVRSVDREARNYFGNVKGNDPLPAMAVVVGSPLSRIIGNFWLVLNKPPYPTRLFSSEAAALEWLKGFVE